MSFVKFVMRISPVNFDINFYGKKEKQKYEALPDYQKPDDAFKEYGSNDSKFGIEEEKKLGLIKNKDLAQLSKKIYLEYGLSANLAGYILGMDSGLENIKDKKLKTYVVQLIKDTNENIEPVDIHFAEPDYEEAIGAIGDTIDAYNTLNGNYTRLYSPKFGFEEVKYTKTHLRNHLEKLKETDGYISQKTFNDLENLLNNKKNYKCTTKAEEILESSKIEPLSSVARFTDVSDYIYEKFYLNTNRVSPRIRKICLDIKNQFGTKVFLPYRNDDELNLPKLKFIKKELSLWKKYGKDEAILPSFINLSRINKSYDANIADAYCDYVENGLYLTGIEDNIRHEMTHLNALNRYQRATNDIEFLNLVESVMPSKTIVKDGETKQVLDFEKCKYREEFLKAGVYPFDIKYAYTNIHEFIAVASQGDMSQYSDEFKQVLLKFGLPEFALKLPQINNDIISNVEQVKRIQRQHPECQDYDSILAYYDC